MCSCSLPLSWVPDFCNGYLVEISDLLGPKWKSCFLLQNLYILQCYQNTASCLDPKPRSPCLISLSLTTYIQLISKSFQLCLQNISPNQQLLFYVNTILAQAIITCNLHYWNNFLLDLTRSHTFFLASLPTYKIIWFFIEEPQWSLKNKSHQTEENPQNIFWLISLYLYLLQATSWPYSLPLPLLFPFSHIIFPYCLKHTKHVLTSVSLHMLFFLLETRFLEHYMVPFFILRSERNSTVTYTEQPPLPPWIKYPISRIILDPYPVILFSLHSLSEIVLYIDMDIISVFPARTQSPDVTVLGDKACKEVIKFKWDQKGGVLI